MSADDSKGVVKKGNGVIETEVGEGVTLDVSGVVE